MSPKNKLPLIHLITDYGTGDLAFSEVINRLTHLLPDSKISPLSSPPFSTLNTGFLIYQLAVCGPNKNIFVFSNTAPRTDTNQKRVNNVGEKFKYALLDNSVGVAAVDAKYCFSFLKPHIKTLYSINTKNQGSQFRSRDFYPQAVADILTKNKQILGEKISLDHIPDIPKNKILHIDGYGNIKTTIRLSNIGYKLNQTLTITINNTSKKAIFTKGSFSVQSGELAFSPGSSGGNDPFMEVFLRGHNTSNYFNQPTVGSSITIKTL